MLNFRYHVVSLIAVFLALALGVVLGAGPLQRQVGNLLSSQLVEARQARDDYKGQVGQLTEQLSGHDHLVESLRGELVPGTLPGLQVALVSLPGTDPADVEATKTVLAEAGAQVVADVAITPAWGDPTKATYRSTFAGQLRGYLDPQPAAQADAETVFAQALATMLTKTGEGSATITEFLAQTETKFLTGAGQQQDVAHSVVVLAPRSGGDLVDALGLTTQDEALKAQRRAHLVLAEELAAAARGGIVVGPALDSDDLVSTLRASGKAVSTLDGIGTPTTTVFTPRVLAAAISGKHGAYGVSPSATEGMAPAVQLPGVAGLEGTETPPTPAPQPTDTPSSAATE